MPFLEIPGNMPAFSGNKTISQPPSEIISILSATMCLHLNWSVKNVKHKAFVEVLSLIT